ncbi:hypothetical protein [Rubrolithibacter danxiaensis]|uniref:hypothetical protein n=1 Tax=Rubrolithibacter danxiaensis TaxID=3390805 RepID=UPI003BF88F18
MTFEDFFIKKKIDLAELRKAEPALYSEFKTHFEKMGEKSFDHTKKFWFNKLRRTYHLKEAPKPEKEVIVKTKIASQAEPLSSPTIDQKPSETPVVTPATLSEESRKQTEGVKASIKPKFTPRNITAKPKAPAEGEGTTEEVNKEEATKPVAFKPRFNAKNIKPKEELQPENSSEQAEQPKPAFKPRFNMKNIASNKDLPDPASEEINNIASEETPEKKESEVKPAYKPRFQMKNVVSKTEPTQTAEEKNEEPAAKDETLAEEAKPAYKPRFNMKNIPVKTTTPEDTPEEIKENAPEQKEETKPAYKPRFNMKNIKPKTEE